MKNKEKEENAKPLAAKRRKADDAPNLKPLAWGVSRTDPFQMIVHAGVGEIPDIPLIIAYCLL